MAGGGELGADLVGAAGEQLALYQDSPPAVRRVLYKVAALLPPGTGREKTFTWPGPHP